MLATYLRTSKMPVVILEGLGAVAAKLRTSNMPAVKSRVLETTAILEELFLSLPQPRHDPNILWMRILLRQ